MSRARLISTVAALGLGAAAATAGAAAGPAAKPSVRFAGLIPARVQGLHFGAGEKVWVTLRAGTSTARRMTHASSLGVISVDFGRIADQDRCSGSVSLLAVGASGDRAVYKLPLLACPTASSGAYTR
jgi:hypothetical protein